VTEPVAKVLSSSRFTWDISYLAMFHPSLSIIVVDCWVDGISGAVALWDTAEQEDYKGYVHSRTLGTCGSHRFGVDKPESLENDSIHGSQR